MCNIPSNKLDQQPLKDFMYKYTGYHVPSRKQISEIYTKNIFDININKIRNIIGNNYIWMSLDETTDIIGRHPTVVIIGILTDTDYHKPFLSKISF